MQLVSDALGRPAVHQEPVVQPRKKADDAFIAELSERLRREAGRDTGRIAAYFISRGLNGCVPDSLRFHSSLWHEETRTYHPGIVARIDNLVGPMPAIHRVYLDAHGNGKAKVQPNKKALGTIAGGAIRLSVYEPCQPLVLCEGLETGLAVYEATGRQTWACISAVGLELVQVPDDCGPIYIAGDLDRSGRGQQAAHKLASRLSAEGRTVYVMLPDGPIPDGATGIDWLDVFTGAHTMEGSQAA